MHPTTIQSIPTHPLINHPFTVTLTPIRWQTLLFFPLTHPKALLAVSLSSRLKLPPPHLTKRLLSAQPPSMILILHR